MTWPFVSWRRHVAAICVRDAEITRVLDERDGYKRALSMAEARWRDEQWRRIKAEAHVVHMQERIRRVLGLPGF